MDHLDNLNDLVLDCNISDRDEMQRTINAYCDQNDLDPEGYNLVIAQDVVYVDTAE